MEKKNVIWKLYNTDNLTFFSRIFWFQSLLEFFCHGERFWKKNMFCLKNNHFKTHFRFRLVWPKIIYVKKQQHWKFRNWLLDPLNTIKFRYYVWEGQKIWKYLQPFSNYFVTSKPPTTDTQWRLKLKIYYLKN